MKSKLVSLIICTLLIVITIPSGNSLKTKALNSQVPDNSANTRADWIQIQKLLASDGGSFNDFGYSVSLDGDTALIGAYGKDDYRGSVYVFTRTGTTWMQQAELNASDGSTDDHFGWSVSLIGDTALIGAQEDDDNGENSGSAYVFIRTGTTWTQQAKLLASDGASYDTFGYSVSLSGDTALIGADGTDYMKGSVYVYTRTGSTWTQQAELNASDGVGNDIFGWSVSISGDTALVGAYYDDNAQGSAYVFTRTDDTWTQQTKLLASDGEANEWFGYSVSLSGDTALIGTPWDADNGLHSGSTYVFTSTGTTWTQQAKLLASDGVELDAFGVVVSLSGDTAVIGMPHDDSLKGSAYVYTRTGTTWSQQAKLTASDGSEMDAFGVSVCFSDDTALIGAFGDDVNGDYSGSAYVFMKENQPPIADFSWIPHDPIPDQQITFDASTSHDLDGTIISYAWDWNNDNIYEETNTIPTAEHSWSQSGTYPVNLKVTDDDGATAIVMKKVNLSEAVTFTIDITGGFGIKAVITNNGTLNATAIQWKVTLTDGLILLGKTKSGMIPSLSPGGSATVKDSPIVGFGKTSIKLEVTCAEGQSTTQTTGTIFVVFVLGVK